MYLSFFSLVSIVSTLLIFFFLWGYNQQAEPLIHGYRLPSVAIKNQDIHDYPDNANTL